MTDMLSVRRSRFRVEIRDYTGSRDCLLEHGYNMVVVHYEVRREEKHRSKMGWMSCCVLYFLSNIL